MCSPDRRLHIIARAAEGAGLHDFISSLPNGYSTSVGGGGQVFATWELGGHSGSSSVMEWKAGCGLFKITPCLRTEHKSTEPEKCS
ncbi:hypothetical protein B0I35DRAFT_425069 [Stachybotrys elegans]|uniref:Uncharacterized protein n=1 Tax=Stachybotrys elegans TaxID=80388 RepID=A0A8K0WUL3_9HYPO|nr:hypothetical protein B0I35DRAFT_425069 [Stachybotrys elegans]